MDENANKDQPVTISAPPAGSVTIDPQNPLPEPSFLWRRLFAAVAGFFAIGMASYTAGVLDRTGSIEMLFQLTKLVIYAAGVILTYYFVAPSAAELTSIIQSASIFKHSISMAGGQANDSGKSAATAPQAPLGLSDRPPAAPATPESIPANIYDPR